MQQIIVGLTGLKHSGKSTVARAFETAGFKCVPFAAPMRAMLAALLEIRHVDPRIAYAALYGDLKESHLGALGGRSARHALQTLGTEWGRNLMHPDFWVEAWRDAIRTEPLVIADDVRFPNEAQIVRALGGRVIRIARDGRVEGDGHVSETVVHTIKPDETIFNNGDLAALENCARIVATEYAGKHT
jgi:hypothetical protein